MPTAQQALEIKEATVKHLASLDIRWSFNTSIAVLHHGLQVLEKVFLSDKIT
jgi:hypothetical protein